MAGTTPSGEGSMRGVRDQVLALLLSGTKSGTPAQASASTSTWTPGAKLRSGGVLTSPVTPAPSPLPNDTDLRLAEITAGLVAATDRERRLADTIRKLAVELERSEVRIQQLGNDRDKVREHSPEKRQRAARRRSEPLQDGRGAGIERTARRATCTPRQWTDMHSELEQLRREKKEWTRREKIAQKESNRMMTMFGDIRKNTQRVLEERDAHLRVIATLQQQLSERQPATSANMLHTPGEYATGEAIAQSQMRAAPASPVPLVDLCSRQQGDRHSFRQVPSASVPFPEFESDHESAVTSPPDRTLSSADDIAPRRSSQTRRAIEDELRGELQLVVAENTALYDTVSKLQQNCNVLQARIAQYDDQAKLANNGVKTLASEEAKSEEMRQAKERFNNLEDELRILEGVIEALEFSLDTDDAERLQQTLSTIGFEAGDVLKPHPTPRVNDEGDKREAEGGDIFDAINRATQRLADVRCSIANKYGRWLADVAHPNATLADTLTITHNDSLETLPIS